MKHSIASSSILRRLALFLTLLSACSSHRSPPSENIPHQAILEKGIPFIGKSTFDRYRFKNGLTLIVMEDHSSPTFAYHTWYRVGSRNEKVGATGLAHLFEHMMFKQTRNHRAGELDRTLERVGAENFNAFTGTDYTAYIQELPKQHLDLIASFESDRMVNLIVDEAALKTEREVVQNERRQRTENNPEGLMHQEILRVAFEKHPYHWPVIGYEADLNRTTPKDAENFYKSHYHPGNAIIVVTGDVNPAQVASVIEKYYGSLPKVTTNEEPVPVEPEQTNPRKSVLKLNTQVEKMMVGYKIPGNSDSSSAAIDMIEAVLTSGKASRLDRALVDAGIASNVWCNATTAIDPSLFLCSASLQEGKKAETAEQIIQKELDRLGTELISKKELKKARNLIMFNMYQGLGNNHAKASLLGSWEAQFRGIEKGRALLDEIMKVSAEDIRKTAKRFFSEKSRTTVLGVSK